MMSIDNHETIYCVIGDDQVIVSHKIINGKVVKEIGDEYGMLGVTWIFNKYTDQVNPDIIRDRKLKELGI